MTVSGAPEFSVARPFALLPLVAALSACAPAASTWHSRGAQHVFVVPQSYKQASLCVQSSLRRSDFGAPSAFDNESAQTAELTINGVFGGPFAFIDVTQTATDRSEIRVYAYPDVEFMNDYHARKVAEAIRPCIADASPR